ncbi:MAG TPA: glycosyltransferase [Accumulibacter sp.]|nr:glycosyltransferase [Accumulibacter sp.]HMW17539.1 glycosyltransferase [Accumulibacter sp.]HMX22416.1 glycosyltransferase [Accumulibacter sp.]HMY06133.1 glycosyltransferase [Accumulibacter sp.]HNC17617.1 glycosyltransferase [Accumulibacter sp.]
MKFALVTTNLRGGGAEKAMLKFATLLASRDHETHLVLLEHRIEHDLPADVRLSALTRPGQEASKGLLGKHLLAWRLRHLMTALAGTRPFDLILSTLPFADEVCKRARLPRLWHRVANTLSAEIDRLAERDRQKAARRQAKYRHLYHRSRLIAVSDGVALDLQSLKINALRIERLYNPFDVDAIRNAATASAALPSGPFVVHVGRFSPQKRHDLLFAAFRQLPPTRQLVLLCHDQPELRSMIVDHGLENRVVVAGFQTNPYPWIAAADLLVLCSDHEGMPNVLVEALLLGTPVVSTDCPSGPDEILQHGRFGRLVPCNDAPALTRAISDALTGPRRVDSFDPAPFLPAAAVERLEQLAREND